ncbi:MAG: Hpt domain-containing protein, partial [Halioglobus sp.]|nr:Hpt domain-containing protein [Halioglobus sp.]
YLDSAARLMEELGEGAQRGDCQQVQRAAHTLKSSSANIGASHLSACCRTLEHRAREGSEGRFGVEIAAIDAALREVQAEVGALRERAEHAPERTPAATQEALG